MIDLKNLLKTSSIEERHTEIDRSNKTTQNKGRNKGYFTEQISNLSDLIFDDGKTKFSEIKRLKDNTFVEHQITSITQILKTGSDHGADLIKERDGQYTLKSSKIKGGTLSEDSSGLTKLKATKDNLDYDSNKVDYEIICRDKNDVNIRTKDKIKVIDLADLELQYQKLKEYVEKRDYNISKIDQELKIPRRDFETGAHFFQMLALLIMLGVIKHKKGNVIFDLELFTRCRKTALMLKFADELYQMGLIDDLQIDGGILTSTTSFKNDISVTNFKSPINLVEDTKTGKFAKGSLNIAMPSLHGDVNRHQAVIDRPSDRKLVIQDEADAIAPTTKKIKNREDLADKPACRIMMTGTNSARGARGFIPDISIAIAYKDMLKFKHGEGPFIEQSPDKALASVIRNFGEFKDTNHPAFTEAKEFIKSIQDLYKVRNRWIDSVKMYPNKHYFQAKYENTGLNEVPNKDNEIYLNDFNKSFDDVSGNENTLEAVVRALLGTTQDPALMDLQKEFNISQFNKVMKHPMDEGIIFWLPGGSKNKQVHDFAQRVKKWAPNYVVRALIGSYKNKKGTNSHEVETQAINVYKEAKRKNKKGVILIMRTIGERSFSTDFITTGVAMYDGGNLYNIKQQDARDDTPGLTYSGHVKKDSLFISLSVNPDRVSPIDQMIIAGSSGNINEYHSIPGINFWKKDKYGNAIKLEADEHSEQINNKGFNYLAGLLGNGTPIPSHLIDMVAEAYLNMGKKPTQRQASKRSLTKGKTKETETIGVSGKQIEESVQDKETQAHLGLKRIFETLATVGAIANCGTDDMSQNLQVIQQDPSKLEKFVDIYAIEPKFIQEIVDQGYDKLFNTLFSKIRVDRKTQIRKMFETV